MALNKRCNLHLLLLLTATLAGASLPRSNPHSRYSRFLEEIENSQDSEDSSEVTTPPWNASPNIDVSGFLRDAYSSRFGEWEREADLPGRHGYRRVIRRVLRKGGGQIMMRQRQLSIDRQNSGSSGADNDPYEETNEDKLQLLDCEDIDIGTFTVRQVPGDGNCLFHSLSLCLYHAEKRVHLPLTASESFRDLFRRSRDLRNMAVKSLQSGGDDRRLFLQGDEYLTCQELLSAAASQYNISPDEYCNLMAENCTWGGGPEIVALSNALRRPIHVYELSVHDEAGNNDHQTNNGILTSNSSSKKFHFSRMACFGSPKFDSRAPLHILSADSRFPDIQPGRQLSSGNHFLALFPVKSLSSKTQVSTHSLVRGGKLSGQMVQQDSNQRRIPRVITDLPPLCMNSVLSIARAVEFWICSLCGFTK